MFLRRIVQEKQKKIEQGLRVQGTHNTHKHSFIRSFRMFACYKCSRRVCTISEKRARWPHQRIFAACERAPICRCCCCCRFCVNSHNPKPVYSINQYSAYLVRSFFLPSERSSLSLQPFKKVFV